MPRNARVILLVCLGLPIFGQNQATPSFEVADVKANQSGELRMSVDFAAGAKFTAHNVPMKILIALAYHVRPDAVTEGPGWLASSRYDVVAKASQTSSPEDLRRMLQGLLAERFKLVVHKDQKVMPAYAMEVGKGGLKVSASGSAPLSEQRCVPGDGAAGQKHVICSHMTMALLADTLQEIAVRDLDVPVVNQTGIEGNLDFKLDWVPAVSPTAPPSDDPPAGPTLFEAIEAQVGIRLQRTRLPLPVIVVDSVERVPSGN